MEFHSAHSTLILPRRTEVGFLAGSASVWRCLATRLDLDDGEVTAALHHQVERLTQTSDEIATCARDEVVRQVRDVATDVVPPRAASHLDLRCPKPPGQVAVTAADA